MEKPYLGFGLGLRAEHYDTILKTHPTDIDWFEIISENYMVPGGRPLYFLDKIRERYPVVMHGVSMSIGSCDPLDMGYLKQLKQLADRVEAKWVSDHLCWTGINHLNMHDLLPVPFTQESLQHIVNRVKQVQDYLGRQILLENPSTYLTFQASDMTEWTFLSELAKQADCFILLDINNIYVSAFNHGFDAMEYLNAIPVDRVWQFHLAGHQNNGDHIVDTHDAAVIDDVWSLYRKAVERFGKVSVMVERDDNIPPLAELIEEVNETRNIAESIYAGQAA